MAENSIPKNFSDLLRLASECKAGATALGASIPLVLNTGSIISSDRANLVQSQVVYRGSLSGLPELRLNLKQARQEGRAFATKTRNWLEYSLGSTHSLRWSDVGFDNNSLRIPRDDAGLVALLERMYLYLQANASQANPDPKVNVTAVRGQAAWAALDGVINAMNTKEEQIATKKDARDQAADGLRRRLRGLVNELGQHLADTDQRWRRFGLNLPAAPNVPAVPRDVKVNTDTPGEFHITCARSANATSYRFFTLRPGVDEEPVFAGNSPAPMFDLHDLRPGDEYQVLVTAVNAGAESRLSNPVSATVRAEDEAAA